MTTCHSLGEKRWPDLEVFAHPPWWPPLENVFFLAFSSGLAIKIHHLLSGNSFALHVVDGCPPKSILFRVCCFPPLIRKLSAAFQPWRMHKIDLIDWGVFTLFVSFFVVFFIFSNLQEHCVANTFRQGWIQQWWPPLIWSSHSKLIQAGCQGAFGSRGDTQYLRCSTAGTRMECGVYAVCFVCELQERHNWARVS